MEFGPEAMKAGSLGAEVKTLLRHRFPFLKTEILLCLWHRLVEREMRFGSN